VRLRLEPVSNIEELRKLAWTFREARHPVKDLPQKGHAWPEDIIDYWLRHSSDLRKVCAYRLDPAKGPLATKGESSPQVLPAGSEPVELTHLRKLIRVDFVARPRPGLSEKSLSHAGGNPLPRARGRARRWTFATAHAP